MCQQIMIQICILQCVYSEKAKCVLPNVLGWFLEDNLNAWQYCLTIFLDGVGYPYVIIAILMQNT